MNASTKRPNILFLFSDQHAFSFLGSNGHTKINTPCLDSLAEEGVFFENAYCQNPLCVPSRSSLLTGRYSRNLGIYENRHILESNALTLPRVLSNAGYSTCVIGKTHLNGEQYQGYAQRPFGDFFGQAHQPEYIRKSGDPDESGLGDILVNSGPTAIPLPMTQTEICVSESAKWLQQHVKTNPERPFFLSVNFDKPHFPYRPPQKYFDHYNGHVALPSYPKDYALLESTVPFVKASFIRNGAWNHYGIDRDIHERALASYYGCVEWVDDAVGRILDVLKYLGLNDHTIFIYTSDHGEMAGEKGAWQKSVFFDASSKVPLIIRWPGSLLRGSRIGTLTALLDLFPTICRAAGCDIPDTCDGVDLSGLISRGEDLVRDAIFCESVVLKQPEHAGCMIRTSQFKFSLYLDGYSELYDMEQDTREECNLTNNPDYRLIKDELSSRIIRFWEPEKQLDRYRLCPKMEREKHYYLSSNQFMGSDGQIIDSVP